MHNNEIKQALLEVEEIKLKAQLRAIRDLLRGDTSVKEQANDERKSQVEYVYQLLKEVKKPLHVKEIINLTKEMYGIELYRESIVSALLKKVNRYDRFSKTGKNIFGLIEYSHLYRSSSEQE